ncbi:MAG: HD domain-containing protein, partial [Bacteroidia bacterium]|nr:HD domain-containing protein [Bacteroidia bacterium]
FFLNAYPSNHLISHGLEHHRRVWVYAKEIISYSDLQIRTEKRFLKELIIACFFHDIGMALNHGINHGDTSLKKTIEFMEKTGMNPIDYTDALHAIEYHDDKEYITEPGDNKVLEILSVADDLDAFGITGIYRYAEIYLKRGISFADIGSMITKNALIRFENLEKKSWLSVEFMRRHRERYNYLIDFFRDYNSQLGSYNFNSANPAGPCGIIQILSESDSLHFQKNPQTFYNDQYITNFFNKLNAENEIIRKS